MTEKNKAPKTMSVYEANEWLRKRHDVPNILNEIGGLLNLSMDKQLLLADALCRLIDEKVGDAISEHKNNDNHPAKTNYY